MTRESQKDHERSILRLYLKRHGILLDDCPVAEGERPDFIVTLDDRQVGVELTAYHSDRRRRAWEERWNQMVAEAMDREDYPLFRFVTLRFIERMLPSSREMSSFIDEVIALASAPFENEATIPINALTSPIAAKYITHIDLHPFSHPKTQWVSNKGGGWFGANEIELIDIVNVKGNSFERPTDWKWLLIFEGGNVSQLMGFFNHEHVKIMNGLTGLLNDGPIDRLALLQNDQIIEWNRGEGWSGYRWGNDDG